ncbi:TPA: VanB-type vancomycin resistance histidine kinase VanS, partial [Enterococcus faecium]|nr:VanB-type vancomycin resistance histidine kinase VanS [Enterococcus faecium]
PIAEPLDIGRTVAELLPDFQTLAEANNQRFVTDIPAGQIVLSDPRLLQKALSNVILNAVQNTPQGGEVRIWSEPGAEKCRLFVLNMGVHIDDTALPRLFTPFYRIDQARSRKSGRSGLGLAIVQKTLDAMSLQYALENTSDGVLFWLDLPLTSTL